MKKQRDFSVSPRSKSFFFLFLGGTFIRLGGLLGLGLGLGPGLDNRDTLNAKKKFILMTLGSC